MSMAPVRAVSGCEERAGVQTSWLSSIFEPLALARFDCAALRVLPRTQIGALKDIRNDMSTIKAQLFNRVLDELQLHLYNKGKYR